MSLGVVYVLSNPSMPNMVKIGMSARTAIERANDLYQTGVPTPFVVELELRTPNCRELEVMAHKHFSDFRVSDSREFFNVSPSEAESYLIETQRFQISEWVNYFDEGLAVVDELVSVPTDTVEILALKAKVEPYTIALVLDEIEPDDLVAATERYFEKCRVRKVRMDAGIGMGSLDADVIAAEIAAKNHVGPVQ